MATQNSIILAADTSKRWLAGKNWDPKMFDYLFLGITIGQPKWFYGSPWAAALMGAPGIPGMTVQPGVHYFSHLHLPGRHRRRDGTLPQSLLPDDGQMLERSPHRMAQPAGTRGRSRIGELGDGQLRSRSLGQKFHDRDRRECGEGGRTYAGAGR